MIANTDEKYMALTIGRFQFMDSLQHLGASLEKLRVLMVKHHTFRWCMRPAPSYSPGKGFTLMSTWTALNGSVKQNSHQFRPLPAL